MDVAEVVVAKSRAGNQSGLLWREFERRTVQSRVVLCGTSRIVAPRVKNQVSESDVYINSAPFLEQVDEERRREPGELISLMVSVKSHGLILKPTRLYGAEGSG